MFLLGTSILFILNVGSNPNQPTFGIYTIIPTTSVKTLESVQNYKGIQPYNNSGAQDLNNLTQKAQIAEDDNGVVTLTPAEQKQFENPNKQPGNSKQSGNPPGQSIKKGVIQGGTSGDNKITKIDNGSSSQITTNNKNLNPGSLDNTSKQIKDKDIHDKTVKEVESHRIVV